MYIGQVIVAVTSVNIQDLDTIITCIYFSVAKQKYTYSLYGNGKKNPFTDTLSIIKSIRNFFFSKIHFLLHFFNKTKKTIVHSPQITLMHFNQKVVFNNVHNLYIETL